MPAPRRTDTEEYQRATRLAREVRVTVAEQLSTLVLEGDQMGSGEKLRQRIELVVLTRRDIVQARAVQEQHATLGLPLAPAVRQEREGLEALRAAVMMVGVAAAEWVADMDFTTRRRELALTNGVRRATEEEI